VCGGVPRSACQQVERRRIEERRDEVLEEGRRTMRLVRTATLLAAAAAALLLWPGAVSAVETPIPGIDVAIGTSDEPGDVTSTLSIVLMLTVLSLSPAILILMTSFT